VIQVEHPAAELAEAVGLIRPRAKRRRKNGRSCEDCYFHRNLLCALDLDEPCSTFRPDGPEGLAPPTQPALLVRQPTEEAAAGDGLAVQAA
jgi:hypothetical protein